MMLLFFSLVCKSERQYCLGGATKFQSGRHEMRYDTHHDRENHKPHRNNEDEEVQNPDVNDPEKDNPHPHAEH